VKNVTLYIVAGVVGLLLVVGISGGAAFLVMKTYRPGTTAASAPAAGAPSQVALDAGGGKVVGLKPFTTNLADRPALINVTFELVARNDKEAEKIQANLPLLRDTIVALLNTKKSMEVTGEAGANKLKSEIQVKANEVLGGQFVLKVLMTDSVVQF
jgi:flagellar protein FliL